MKAKVKDIINIMNHLAPKKFAESWDNPGLQIGNPDREIETVLTALDVTVDVVKKAVEKKAGMIITHHPLLFKPLKCLRVHHLLRFVLYPNLYVQQTLLYCLI